ncbi:MAG: AEC family transporter [Clostridia bacterium]|nr:AEC family transporter [Clostridia bacterium]
MLETLLHSLSAVLVVVIMACIGYLFGRKGWMKPEHKGLIVKLIINVGMPALCFHNVFDGMPRTELASAGYLLGIPLAAMAVTMALSLLLAKLLKIEPRRRGGFVVMCSLSNTIFVGLPMCRGLFGDDAIVYVMFFYIINTSLFWTAGNYMLHASGGGEKHVKLKKLLSPPLIALGVCIPLFLAGFEPPQLMLDLSSYLSGIITPLGMLYVGYLLCESGIRNLRVDRGMAAVLAMRFVAAPAVTLLLCKLVGFSGIGMSTFVIESAMPVMTQAVVVAGSANADETYVAQGMSLTTLACFVVTPLLMLLTTVLN